jgi:hypothetical protein
MVPETVVEGNREFPQHLSMGKARRYTVRAPSAFRPAPVPPPDRRPYGAAPSRSLARVTGRLY